MIGTIVEIGNNLILAYQEVMTWLSYELNLGEYTVTLLEVILGGAIATYITVAIIKWLAS